MKRHTKHFRAEKLTHVQAHRYHACGNLHLGQVVSRSLDERIPSLVSSDKALCVTLSVASTIFQGDTVAMMDDINVRSGVVSSSSQ